MKTTSFSIYDGTSEESVVALTIAGIKIVAAKVLNTKLLTMSIL
jgi:hypothetical protein